MHVNFVNHVVMSELQISCGKKSNFAGFSETNLRKIGLILWEFRRNSQANFTKKQLVKNGQFRGNFLGKFC